MMYSRLLVFFQFLFLTVLFVPFGCVQSVWGNVVASGLFTLAVGLFVWILFHNKSGNFNIVPEPKEHANFVCSGPYRFVRHPMYTGVMLIALGAMALQFALWKIAIVMLLCLVLFLKARREEGFWHLKEASYCDYKRGTKMFIPCLF